uniref:Respiratory nitrate reductase beta chain (Fragments) n=1 Tax=Bradyrhizobium sp. TaxID=376 RepID=NARH_BRASZ|nr:RecName: Full=Respiratory nitrate reductase beta chain; AltName: Full=Respiratory membrane-bound nitrate reductase subunit beta [Bradyrhizobium sp.]
SQVGMVLNLDKCIGCHTCSVTCKEGMEYAWFNNVESKLCEHCLNPACVATCPSGAIYKREEDGIVLIDQDKLCISGCPYKCIFCYPRIESGQPTVCSETCVGRYLGVLLYDADRIEEAASTEHETDLLYERQLDVFLDPNDPKVIEQAIKQGIPQNVIDAAQRSPVYKLALPLHPEYRAADAGELGSNGILPDVESLRMLSAGDTGPVIRSQTVEGVTDTRALEEVGLTEAQAQEMYRYLAIANYEDRFVVPSSHRIDAINITEVR